MAEFYTLPGIPSDLLDADNTGTRNIKTNDKSLRDAVDFTNSIITIDEQHALIHKGIVFTLTAKITLPSNGTSWMVGESNGSSVHWQNGLFVANEGGIEITFREDVVTTEGSGEVIPAYNRSRREPVKQSSFVVKANPTVLDDGTSLELFGLPAASGPQTRAVLSVGDPIEWNLAQGKKYGLRLDNLENRQKTVYGTFVWYEPGLLQL